MAVNDPVVGELGQIAITVSDVARAKAFYGDMRLSFVCLLPGKGLRTLDRILMVSGICPPDRAGLPPARAAAPARVHGSVMV